MHSLLPPDDNECMLGTDNCDDNALCIDTFGGFLCNCNSGFRGNGMTCLGEWVHVAEIFLAAN